ncbi:unnamed protein product [Parnassius apollo]|uniref:1-acylglycerol-3-phosphate O-acyltransferase n=1 Tax=Parnassius apollo TaxID=110799 RepID=A0A8S3XFZ3_PARAO|nr:unnamed protein product [Parnassius apollo]
MLGFLRQGTAGFRLNCTRKILYNALVRSNLEYASVAWNPVYVVHSQRLEGIQRAFTRHLAFITQGVSHRSPYEHRLAFFKMNSLRSRRRDQDLVFLHGLVNGKIKCNELLERVTLTVPARIPRHPIKKLLPCLLPKCVYNAKFSASILKHVTKLYDLKWELRRGEILAEERGAIIVSNHRSSLDILGLFNIWELVDKLTVIAKKELMYAFPFGLMAYLSGIVFIE